MKKSTIILSAVTAFIIGLSTAIVTAVVEAKGGLPSAASWLVALFGALGVAAKDNRALMKLPGIEGDSVKVKRLLLWLPLVLLLAGCGSTPAKKAAIVHDTSRITVEHALSAYNDWIPIGHPPETQQLQVYQAWSRYREARVLLLDTAILLREAEDAGLQTPEQVAALNRAIAEAGQAQASLIRMIAGFLGRQL